ncbi:hypothetical protein IQ250_06915 [Pseudanabaenaceae cyanobacterium LEGE 13415]|nr:hypothetical protein [Pseudanabaenaceae cyanobacterium LEGE 13415]
MNSYNIAIEPLRLLLGSTLEDPNPAPSPTVTNDPLVNHRWESFPYIAAIAFVIILIVGVGVVSKKVEHAIAAALISSLLLIGFFFLTNR